MPIKSLIRTVPHYPKQGVMFRDITTLLKDPVGFRVTINEFVHRYTGVKIDKIAAIESRGFIIGAALAFQLGVGFVPIRKRGKLPAATVGHDYELEYGFDRVELHLGHDRRLRAIHGGHHPADAAAKARIGQRIERDLARLTDLDLDEARFRNIGFDLERKALRTFVWVGLRDHDHQVRIDPVGDECL